MRVAVVSSEGLLLGSRQRKTPVKEGPEATAVSLSQMICELAAEHPVSIRGIGIGSPGPLSRSEKRIFHTPNLPGFDGFPLGHRMQSLTSLPVFLDNDAKCATFGEALYGAARGARHVIMLTFGTGVGGGVIADGHMIYGKGDNAGEIGHLTLYPNGQACNCGNRGCLEQYLSARAIGRRATERAGRAVGVIELMDAHARDKKWATDLLREIATDLAIAVASLVNIFEPEVIVLGGGVFSSGGGPLCPWVAEEIRERCFASSQLDLRIVASTLGGDAGVLGAASLVHRSQSI